MRKKIFGSNSPCITYLLLFFTGRKKFERGTSTRCLRGPVARRPWDQMMRVLGTSIRHVGHTSFLNSIHKHIKLTLTGYIKTL